MPLSSLQEQLAAIQDGGKYKTSIKHDQAVGRGAQFSVQTGARRPASHRFQPSLVYETASEAADVPLSTLQTQFEEAVLVLGEAEPELLDRTDRLLRTEASADESSSPTFQKTLQTTLYLIASLLASSSEDDPERFRLPARYTLEYLLRKFQLHIDFPIDLFWSCWLSNDDQLLQRCWELIDWGQVTAQSYATSLRLGCGTVAVRRLVRQHADVMRTIVTWTQMVATTAVDPARVVAQSAALVLPAIREMQQLGSSSTAVASEEQQTALLRTLLPVLQFRGHNDDFVHWSFCVASALVEAVDVSQLVLNDLCGRMLVATMDDEDEDATRRTTAVTCVLSLLLVPRSNDSAAQSQSLLLPVGDEYWIGCTALSDIIYQRLILDQYWWEVVEALHTSLVFTPVLMTAICRAVQHRDMATIQKVVGLFVLGLEQNKGKPTTVCDALLAYLEQNAVEEPSLFDALRPHCGGTVQLQKPALLLNDTRSALLYVEQSIKEGALDWKLLASHIHLIAPQHAVRLASTIVEAATQTWSTASTKETVIVVAHFAPHHTCATACLWSWTTAANKNMKRVRKAAGKALCDISLRDSIVAATAHVASAAVPVLQAVAKAEWIDDIDLVDGVAGLCLAFLQTLDTMADVHPSTTKALKGLVDTVLQHRTAAQQHEWIVALASTIQPKSLWATLASDLLPTVGVKGILSACNLPDASTSSIARLLSLLVEDKAVDTVEATSVLLPTLCFLANDHAGVRSAAAQVVSKLLPSSSRSSTVLVSIRDAIAESIGAAQLGGMTYLSTLLARACKTNKNKEQLLSMCVEHAGTARTARTILEACEMAGEEAFPLVLRWDCAGQPMLRSLLKKKDDSSSDEDEGLLLTLSRLLKGVTVADPTKVGIVSSGKGGGRVRSYSVGNSSGIQLVSSYPSSMTQAIETILKGSNSRLRAVLLENVLCSQSWQNLFAGLTKERKGSLTRSLVDHICRESDSTAESTFMSFPLTCEDLVGLLKGKHELGPLSVIVDFVRDNGGSLMRETESPALYSQLFRILETLTTTGSLTVESEFVVQSLLAGLKKLLDSCPVQSKVELKKKELNQWLQSLLVILKAEQVPKTIKTFAVSVFTSLCPRSPKEVTPFLIRASVASVDPTPSETSDQFSLHSFTKLMLSYSKFAETSSLSLTDLFVPWLAAWTSAVDRSRREQLVSSVARFSSRSNDASLRDNLFCIVGIYLASRVNIENADESPASFVAFVVDLVASLPQHLQMETLLAVIDSVMGLVSIFHNGTSPTDSVATIKTASMDLALVAVDGLASPTKKRKKSNSPTKLKGNTYILRLCTALLTCFGDSLLLDDVQWCIEKGKKDLTKLTLRLWQDILVLESATRSFFSVGNSSTSPIINLVTECKEQLQRLLPADLFLASTTTLICDGDTKEMKSKALRLVAEKALNFNVESPERVLFLDVVPIVVRTVRDLPTIESRAEEDSVLLQSALVALEHITRTFVQNVKGKMPAETLQGFLDALQLCNKLVALCTSDKAVASHLEGVLSCAALCASSLIRSLGPLCLSELPKLMTSLITSLQHTACLGNPSETKDVVRVSILRPITSVLESVPQFSTPFLPKLLHSQAALSLSLRGEAVSELLQEAVRTFDTALGEFLEPRILIPAASRAGTEEDAPESIIVLFRILTASVSRATPACVAINRSNIMKAVFCAFDHKGNNDKSDDLLEAACNVIDTTLLKLSEVQLRKLYSSLRDWRGEFDASDPEKTSRKRYAFWTVTARLCKTLRMIFLPCLVLEDLTTELALAVNNLCKSSSDPVNKKRKITRNYGAGSFQVLSPLLSSLENALRSDAHQGGKWIRDGERRYEEVMEPLTKLLHCRVSEELSSSVTFEHVVHQAADGNVVSSLVALASAVGDEHSWKPMNHAVLQACSDDRAEVRQAGLLCLMEFMKALGEEYMTLLPENLPVLSDLLEDPNEEVALLTKEVIALSEEITGENLEENLR